MSMDTFELVSPYKPTGDQPQAIDQLAEGLNKHYAGQTLLGVVGPGQKSETRQALIDQAQGKMLGLLLGNQVKTHPLPGYYLQGLFIGQVKLNQFFLGVPLTGRVLVLVRMAGLHPLAVGRAHSLLVRIATKAQHLKILPVRQADHLPRWVLPCYSFSRRISAPRERSFSSILS